MSDDAIRALGALDELRQILPTDQIESHGSGLGAGAASYAVEPASRTELTELLSWANERGAAVYTRRPREEDAAGEEGRVRIYLRGHRMARVVDLDIVSGTVTVQSGITMRELHRSLEERGYTTGFPTRAWRDEPLGAVVAAVMDAHWGPAYGSRESEVLGLGVVLPDGTDARSRVAPRKAVGPDFDRIFLGSRGRFGIVYEVTLRIYPSSVRQELAYAARDLTEALASIRLGYNRGLAPRAIEILTPAPDRSWGAKRVGLSAERPVLVLVEPWGRQSSVSGEILDAHMSSVLERLEPPVGWHLHEGLLPPPRGWKAPVVGVPWQRLAGLATELGADTPAGLWVVRMSRHGAWVSLAEGVEGPQAAIVRALIQEHTEGPATAWSSLGEAMRLALDPQGVLNPRG
jgi:FAD/FMN-containing dehydrogenase